MSRSLMATPIVEQRSFIRHHLFALEIIIPFARLISRNNGNGTVRQEDKTGLLFWLQLDIVTSYDAYRF